MKLCPSFGSSEVCPSLFHSEINRIIIVYQTADSFEIVHIIWVNPMVMSSDVNHNGGLVGG